MSDPLGVDRNRGSEIHNTFESDTYFALQMIVLDLAISTFWPVVSKTQDWP